MKLGLFTPVFGSLDARQMLAKVQALGKVQALEIGTGGWPGNGHLDMECLLSDKQRLADYRLMIADAGLTISALSCHGNPLHPNADIAREYDEVFRKTVCLAHRMEVPVVVTFSGCPGDSEDARHPNWVTTPWPPEFLDVLEWQWGTKAIPYWTEAAAFADTHFMCVGTPQRSEGNAADLSFLHGCIDTLAPLLSSPCTVVGHSSTTRRPSDSSVGTKSDSSTLPPSL